MNVDEGVDIIIIVNAWYGDIRFWFDFILKSQSR